MDEEDVSPYSFQLLILALFSQARLELSPTLSVHCQVSTMQSPF